MWGGHRTLSDEAAVLLPSSSLEAITRAAAARFRFLALLLLTTMLLLLPGVVVLRCRDAAVCFRASFVLSRCFGCCDVRVCCVVCRVTVLRI